MGGVCTAVLLFPPDRGEWGDLVESSLSNLHFLCIGCTLHIWQLNHTFLHISCQICANKYFKEIFKIDLSWIWVGCFDVRTRLSHGLVDQAHLVDLVGELAGHLVSGGEVLAPGGGVLVPGSVVGGGSWGGGHPV